MYLSVPVAASQAAAAAGCQPPQFMVWRLASLRSFTPHASSSPKQLEATAATCLSPSTRRHPRRLPPPAASFEQQQWQSSSTNSRSGGPAALQVRRALGLDYGRRVVGLAVSTLGLAPRPLEGLPGCASASEQLATAAAALEVAEREGCDAVVVGLPVTATGNLRQRGTDSQQGRRCRNFATNLAALAAPRRVRVFLADERGSTLLAREALAASGSRKSAFGKVGGLRGRVMGRCWPSTGAC